DRQQDLVAAGGRLGLDPDDAEADQPDVVGGFDVELVNVTRRKRPEGSRRGIEGLLAPVLEIRLLVEPRRLVVYVLDVECPAIRANLEALADEPRIRGPAERRMLGSPHLRRDLGGRAGAEAAVRVRVTQSWSAHREHGSPLVRIARIA